MMKINWINLLDGIIITTLWILLILNLFQDKLDYAMVYAVVIVAWRLDDIASVMKVKKDE